MSGSTNVGAAFDMLASRRAAESTYAGIVRLVEAAQRSRAPMSRLADRYAMVFLAATIALAGVAWLWSGDPIRAVAVLVVATPCPLILAVPVAFVSGLSRAARQGILIKGGKALETLAQVRSLVIDKTGTLTYGAAKIGGDHVKSDIPSDELLRLAASLDQASKHIVAQTIVNEARGKGLALTVPSEVAETAGEGIEGCVDGRRVIVGGVRFVTRRTGIPTLAMEKAPGADRRGGRRRRKAGRRPHPCRRIASWHGSAVAAPPGPWNRADRAGDGRPSRRGRSWSPRDCRSMSSDPN